MHPAQQPTGGMSHAMHQPLTVYGNSAHMPAAGSQGYPLPSQPLHGHQHPSPQQLGLPATNAQFGNQLAHHQSNAPPGPSYQPDGSQLNWHNPAPQHLMPHQPQPHTTYSSAPQAAYAQQQQQQYPALNHARAQNQGTASTSTRLPVQPYPQQRTGNSTNVSAPGVNQPPSAQVVSPVSSGRGFTPSQLNVLRNQILAFRRIKVSITISCAHVSLALANIPLS